MKKTTALFLALVLVLSIFPIGGALAVSYSSPITFAQKNTEQRSFLPVKLQNHTITFTSTFPPISYTMTTWWLVAPGAGRDTRSSFLSMKHWFSLLTWLGISLGIPDGLRCRVLRKNSPSVWPIAKTPGKKFPPSYTCFTCIHCNNKSGQMPALFIMQWFYWLLLRFSHKIQKAGTYPPLLQYHPLQKAPL